MNVSERKLRQLNQKCHHVQVTGGVKVGILAIGQGVLRRPAVLRRPVALRGLVRLRHLQLELRTLQRVRPCCPKALYPRLLPLPPRRQLQCLVEW